MNTKKDVELKGCLDARGQSHYATCKLFVQIAIIYFAVKLFAVAVNIGNMIIRPESGIKVTNSGGHLYFDLLFGRAGIGPDYLPAGIEIINVKILCAGFMLAVVAVNVIPTLIVLNLIWKILKLIGNSYSPFTKETADYTWKAGKVLIVMGVIGKLAIKITVQLLACGELVDINFTEDLQIPWIMAGVIVLLVSDIFRRGYELQQFSDETL